MLSRTRSGERAAGVAHEHRTAAGLFALLVLVYLWPALVEGHPLLPAAVLYQVAPWQPFAPPDVSHYLNPGLVDAAVSYYPWDVLARRLIHAGTFPAWNPYAFGGTPFFANPEVAWVSPFSLPLWLLPLNYGLGVAAALKLWMAGFGTYLLVRELRLGFAAGILAGVAFMLCTFNVVWLSLGAHVSVAVLLPWTIWLVERVVRRGRPVEGIALAGVVAFVLTGGHPGTQLHVLAAAVLYALARAATSRGIARPERLRRLAVVGGALVVGGLIAAVTLLPAEQAALHTAGAAARRNGGSGFPGSHMSVGMLRTALFPDWWGRPSEIGESGPANYSERAFYAGTATLLLAVVALLSAGDWRRKAPFALLGALALGVGLRAPVLYDVVVQLPLFDRVQNQRILLLYLFAVTIFGAFGLQAVLDSPPARRRAWGVLAGATIGALVAATSVHGAAVARALDAAVRRSPQVTDGGVLALAGVGWFLALALAFGALLALATWWPAWRRLAAGLVVLLAALDMLHYAHGYQSMGPAGRAIPPRTPAIAFLQRHAGTGRIAGVQYTLANDWSSIYGLRDARGYDAPQPSLSFDRLWREMNPGQVARAAYSFPALSPASQRVLSLLGARYAIAEPGTEPRSRLPALRPAYRGRDATIFANGLAMERAIVAEHVLVADEERAAVAAVMAPDFDPRRAAVVPSDRSADASPPTRAADGHAAVRVVREANTSVTLHAELPRRALIVLDDAWAPGWSVRVDGRPARALPADVILRGVVVPAGTHEIVWSYRVPGLRAGVALSLLGLLLLAAWAAWAPARRRRRRERDLSPGSGRRP